MRARLAAALAASVEAARTAADQDTLEALLGRAPICAPSLLYQSGMLHLNGTGPSTQALLCFELSAVLAERAYALAPALMQAEADRRGAARFHAGVVLSRMGEAAAARGVFESLANGSQPTAPAAVWAERARAELALTPTPGATGARAARASRPRRAAGSRP